LKTSENAARGRKMPFTDGHYRVFKRGEPLAALSGTDRAVIPSDGHVNNVTLCFFMNFCNGKITAGRSGRRLGKVASADFVQTGRFPRRQIFIVRAKAEPL
jgi:hypothetical protein